MRVNKIERLWTWGEIAAFLGTSEKTAKRWTREKGMPVRKHPGGRVYAFSEELLRWEKGGGFCSTKSGPPSKNGRR